MAMDYSQEPAYSPLLNIQGTDPLNAEPPASALVEFPITPENLVYNRNHGPVRIFDPDSYTLSLSGIGLSKSLDLSVHTLKTRFVKHSVEAVLQCAGNRRREMTAIKPVNGILWLDGTIANCKWGGAKLSDMLHDAGIDRTTFTNPDDLHVCFTSYATLCQDDKYYGSSIPLLTALDPNAEILLAYEMNDDPLTPHHGGPLRLVAPGFLGARWVKWLDNVILSTSESPNYYQQRDYKVLPPSVENKAQAAPLWKDYPAMTTMPLNSVIGSALPLTFGHESGSTKRILVKGYATNGHTSPVVGVDISVDEGETWTETNLTYIGGKWGWRLWECEIEVEIPRDPKKVQIFSRARDEHGNLQPQKGTWNLRGVQWCGWGNYVLN